MYKRLPKHRYRLGAPISDEGISQLGDVVKDRDVVLPIYAAKVDRSRAQANKRLQTNPKRQRLGETMTESRLACTDRVAAAKVSRPDFQVMFGIRKSETIEVRRGDGPPCARFEPGRRLAVSDEIRLLRRAPE